MVFTALPLLAKAIWEQDINPKTDGDELKPYLPKLYYVGQKSTIFNWTNYFIWILNGIAHSVIVFVIPYYAYLEKISSPHGQTADMWVFSVTSFTSVIIVRYNTFRLNNAFRLSTLN
jgi:magnesium-transporting ATPase (P-type)